MNELSEIKKKIRWLLLHDKRLQIIIHGKFIIDFTQNLCLSQQHQGAE